MLIIKAGPDDRVGTWGFTLQGLYHIGDLLHLFPFLPRLILKNFLGLAVTIYMVAYELFTSGDKEVTGLLFGNPI